MEECPSVRVSFRCERVVRAVCCDLGSVESATLSAPLASLSWVASMTMCLVAFHNSSSLFTRVSTPFFSCVFRSFNCQCTPYHTHPLAATICKTVKSILTLVEESILYQVIVVVNYGNTQDICFRVWGKNNLV